MHPLTRSFVSAFEAWDADAMAAALIAMFESSLGGSLSESERLEVIWPCRELLELLTFHPSVSDRISPRSHVACDVQIEIEWTRRPRVEPHPTFVVDIEWGAWEHWPQAKRWQSLGLDAKGVRIPRARVRTPTPLKDEPGFDPDRQRVPAGMPATRPEIPPTLTYAHALAAADQTTRSNDWLARYEAGQNREVWAEMVALGDRVRDPAHIGPATAVARETMRRARRNVERLVTAMDRTAYRLEPLERTFAAPDDAVLDQIAEFERTVGALPLSLCAWFEIVGEIDLTGEPPLGTDGPKLPDALVIAPARWALEYDPDRWQRGRYPIDLAPDEYHKLNISGGGPYGIVAPAAAADVRFESEWQRTTFVDYLRRTFAAGGLPGWRRYPAGSPEQAYCDELATGLEPI